MSKYTTEVRFICEEAAGLDESKGYKSVDSIIEQAIPKVFSFDFPVFDESYRNVLCTKILRHYYTREIGLETVALWKLKLETKLNEVMPFYNQLYKSELIKFNPLYDTDLHTTHVGDKQGNSDKTSAANHSSETDRNESRNGISITANERNENGELERSSESVEGENLNVQSSTKTDNASVGSNKRSNVGNVEETGNEDKTGVNGKNYNETESGLNYDLYSDTPQGALVDVDQEEYLTNARKITDSKSKTGKEDTTNIEEANYIKNTENSNVENVESSSFANEDTKNTYDEKADKTNVAKQSDETRNTINDNGIKTDSDSSVGNEKSTGTENAVSFDSFSSTESYVLHVVGKQSGMNYSKMLNDFRSTFLNIDLDVINSLDELFFKLW